MTEAGTITCTRCAAPVEAGWRFCRSCGTRLPRAVGPDAVGPVAVEAGEEATPPSPMLHPLAPVDPGEAPATAELPAVVPTAVAPTPGVLAPDDGRAHRQRRRRRVLVAGAVAAAALLAAGAAWGYETRSDLVETRDELDATQAQLASTEGALLATQADLERRTAERDDLRRRLRQAEGDLASARTELEGVRTSLGDARSRLNLQAGQIATLKTCLQGVSTALVYVTDFDYASAIAALQAVDVACTDASALF